MSIEVIDKIKQKNGGTFKLMDAKDIAIEDTDIEDYVKKLKEGTEENELKYTQKLNKVDLQLSEIANDFDKVVANVTNGNESATNSEIVQARDGEVNLNTRLDKFGSQIAQIINGKEITDGFGDGLITSDKPSLNLFNKNNVKKDYYLADHGVETYSSNYYYGLDYIEIDINKKYAFTGCFGKSAQIILYDENKNYIGVIYSNQCTGSFGAYVCDFSKLNKPLAKFARINCAGELDIYMFLQADVYPSEYIPYGVIKGGKFKSSILKKSVENVVSENVFLGEIVDVNGLDQTISIGKNTTNNINLPCVAIGYGALQNNVDSESDSQAGKFNVAVGSNCLNANTVGNHNTAIGYQAMKANTTGVGNTGVGEDAILANTTGVGNTGVGRYSIFKNIDGNDNTGVGLKSLYNQEKGSKNTALGSCSGISINGGEGNTFVGYYANGDSSINNSTAIGNQAYANKNNQIRLGNGEITTVDTWGDFECLKNNGGIILKSSNGTKFKLTITNEGTLNINQI